MKHRISYGLLGLSLVAVAFFVFAHEKTGWIAPAEARKMKNPIKATKASIQKGKEIYENKCALSPPFKGGGINMSPPFHKERWGGIIKHLFS